MRFSLLLLQAALALASPTSVSSRSDEPNELLLHYSNEIGPGQSELILTTPDKSTVYAHACGNTFDIAGTSVTIKVDERGSGNVSVGDKQYTVVGDREMSGGISCTKLYNEKSTIVECSIPWSDGLKDLSAVSADDVEECFDASVAARRRSLPGAFSHPFAEVQKRQSPFGCFSNIEEKTELVGDGNPHQDTLHKQIGPAQTCAQRGTCFVGVGEEVSLSLSAEIGFGGGPSGWITGGFSVTRTTSSSTERGCYGEAGDTVCQWSRTFHTAYTVTTSQQERCNSAADAVVSDPYIIRSPNAGSGTTEWYCVLNTCRGDGDQYWELGRAGGP